MGDAAGSGPEIITRALADPEISAGYRCAVIGDASVMKEALQITGVPLEVRAIAKLKEALFQHDVIEVIDLKNIQLDQLSRGEVSPLAGKAAFEYINLATNLTLSGECDAIVTSAINKESLNKAGYHYDGHTELLAELCGVSTVAMMLASGRLRITHVTTHASLQKAIGYRPAPHRCCRSQPARR